MNYKTRHLEATAEISHGNRFLKPGDRFNASEVDAEHYVQANKAKVIASPVTPAPAPAPVAPMRGRGRQPAVKAAEAPAEPPAPVASTWERTEPMKLADVPHTDIATPPDTEA